MFSKNSSFRGFTLIELLVVIFIVSLTAGMFLINITLGTVEDEIEEEALRLQSLLRFAHEQSIIRAEEYGLRFHQTGYRFMKLDDEQWHELNSDRHLTSHEFDNEIEIELYIEDIEVTLNDSQKEAELIKKAQDEAIKKASRDPSDIEFGDQETDYQTGSLTNYQRVKEEQEKDIESEIKPQIFLLSSGELIPEFNSRIRIPGVDFYLEIQGTVNGEYTLVKADDFFTQ